MLLGFDFFLAPHVCPAPRDQLPSASAIKRVDVSDAAECLVFGQFPFFPAFASLDCRIHVMPLFPPSAARKEGRLAFISCDHFS